MPGFIAWADAVDSIDAAAARARAAGIETVGPLAGSRARADGTLLAWKTLRLANPPVEGLPFFIEWQAGTVHPSQNTPAGCRLMSFEIENPMPLRCVACCGALALTQWLRLVRRRG